MFYEKNDIKKFILQRGVPPWSYTILWQQPFSVAIPKEYGGRGVGVTSGAFSGNIGVVSFLGYIIGAVIGVFIKGLIILILSYICSGNKNYEANIRVAAAIMVILPVNAFLGFFCVFQQTLLRGFCNAADAQKLAHSEKMFKN